VGGDLYNGIEWLACWLLDNAEGETITEEQLRPWAARAWAAHLKRQNKKTDSASEYAALIYAEYPKKVGRPAALKAIKRALLTIEFDGLLRKVKLYAASRAKEDPAFTPHPATWFNQQRYNDDPETWKVGSTSRKAPEADHSKDFWEGSGL
jgi:hypothetical protein